MQESVVWIVAKCCNCNKMQHRLLQNIAIAWICSKGGKNKKGQNFFRPL